VLLELARVFSGSPTRRSLLFIFTDGGEWGSVGAKDIAETYPQRGRIVAALSLDHVSSGDLAAFYMESTGQLNGFAPPCLRQIARGAAETQGLPVMEGP
jgi:Zn-dependent M28 family amino/carboxypeptidase